MKSAKKGILKAVAKVGAKSAEFGASSASILVSTSRKSRRLCRI